MHIPRRTIDAGRSPGRTKHPAVSIGASAAASALAPDPATPAYAYKNRVVDSARRSWLICRPSLATARADHAFRVITGRPDQPPNHATQTDKDLPMHHPLNRVASDSILPATADVVVIGGGIVGVTAVFDLARHGVKVVLLEKGLIGAEQSSRNWGWVRQQGRDRRELPLIIQSLAIWDELQNGHGIDLGFRRTGLLSLTRDATELARWRRWAINGRAAGIPVQELSPHDAEAAFSSRSARPWLGGLHTPTDAQAEPALAAPAIAEAARRAGATLHQQTAVRSLETSGGAVAGVVTEKGRIATRAVLLAAGAWSSLFLRQHGIRLPQLNVRSTVVRTTPAPELIAGTFCSSDFCLRRRQDLGYSLTLRGDETFDLSADAFRYFFDFLPVLKRSYADIKLGFNGLTSRSNDCHHAPSWGPDYDALANLGNDHRRSPKPGSIYEELRANDPAPDPAVVRKALARFRRARPEVAEVGVADAWAGRIDMTPDLVPVISHVPSLGGLTVATGFSGHGFGIGPGAGRLASDLIRASGPIVDPSPFRLTRFTDGSPLFIDPDVI
jgi:glycine/D-amino acid oxidase-like deaminating enzyme